ncbi:MAG: ABC transporter ATP-binding protein [Deltaproteobacteria bacterium]|nr:ABC transporter ATP-binding protein [Deltaproteobacteria bacterium]
MKPEEIKRSNGRPFPLLEFKSVKKVYGSYGAEVEALRGIDLSVYEGEFIAIMGPSGSGKSTFLNIVGFLDVPTEGKYLFMGVDTEGMSRKERALIRRHFIGFIFQGFNLLPRTSALENVEMPLIYRRVPKSERRKKALEALSLVGLSGWEDHTPVQLSGGQQQRVAIARALVTEPTLLLADEPTGNLDTTRSQEIMELLKFLNQERNLTIVMVTHEPDIASYASRHIHFRDGLVILDSITRGDLHAN